MNKLKQLLACRRQLVTDKRRHSEDAGTASGRSLRALFDRLSQEPDRMIDTQLEKDRSPRDHIHAIHGYASSMSAP
ncbi:MAG: hypothetical protein IPI07_00650 [Flavobacteriales bacterium]|nr:hypothetical protein [Flavobacteriales bacterium]